jgi:16S rRNA (guanine(1405)-N(7))-methyltransferase
MGLGPDLRYHAVDVDHELLEVVATALGLLGVEHRTAVVDLAVQTPQDPADLVLMLCSFTCLERQRPGRGLALLRELDAPRVVVSFPTRSLGGRERGMRSHYARDFEAVLGRESWGHERVELASELVYVVCKR